MVRTRIATNTTKMPKKIRQAFHPLDGKPPEGSSLP